MSQPSTVPQAKSIAHRPPVDLMYKVAVLEIIDSKLQSHPCTTSLELADHTQFATFRHSVKLLAQRVASGAPDAITVATSHVLAVANSAQQASDALKACRKNVSEFARVHRNSFWVSPGHVISNWVGPDATSDALFQDWQCASHPLGPIEEWLNEAANFADALRKTVNNITATANNILSDVFPALGASAHDSAPSGEDTLSLLFPQPDWIAQDTPINRFFLSFAYLAQSVADTTHAFSNEQIRKLKHAADVGLQAADVWREASNVSAELELLLDMLCHNVTSDAARKVIATRVSKQYRDELDRVQSLPLEDWVRTDIASEVVNVAGVRLRKPRVAVPARKFAEEIARESAVIAKYATA